MKEWINNKIVQIICFTVLLLCAIPNLLAIRYAVFTPDDFKVAVGSDTAGNMISILVNKIVNPMVGLNYRLFRMALAVMFVFFVLSFVSFILFLMKAFGFDAGRAIVFSVIVVGTFLFFKEYYEFFFWWTGALLYELPISLILCCLSIYLWGKQTENKIIRIVAVILIALVMIANINNGNINWLRENRDEDSNYFKALYYTLCVVENECKNYLKLTGMILLFGLVFLGGLKSKDNILLIDKLKKKIWLILLPFISVYPIVFASNIYNINQLPNRFVALVDMFLVVYVYLFAFAFGEYAKNKIENVDKRFMSIIYAILGVCTVIFVVNLKNTSNVLICKNLATKQIQNYSDTWSSIYYMCDTTEESDLVIETSVADRVEGCCHPKLRSKTTSEKNKAVAEFFGLNTVSLNNTYKEK